MATILEQHPKKEGFGFLKIVSVESIGWFWMRKRAEKAFDTRHLELALLRPLEKCVFFMMC